MKYSFKKINIVAPFPTRQCGHSSQTYELSDCHDPLYARVTAFRDENSWIIHYSFDLLAFDLASRNELQEYLRDCYQNDQIHVITSTTHTHYANDVRNDRYVKYLLDLLKKETVTMEYRETGNLSTAFQIRHSEAIGRSRISGYDTGNEYLGLIRFYEEDHNFLNLIYCNCHPTILNANVPYFSAEYPGYVLKKLEDAYPETDFTFVQGAAGDISSRFVRSGQDYEALMERGDQLYAEIQELFQEDAQKEPLQLSYKEIPFAYEHEFTPIDLSNMRTDLSDREKETIAIGQQVRAQMESSGSPLFGTPIKEIVISALDLGSVKLVFFPNEIFTEYMNHLKEKELLVSYSNGYGPYILPPDFAYVTYEIFLDTLTKETKERLIEVFENI
ncbi:MAG: hypothetical protein IKS51_05600 [Erysipelotrichaceae bacterium]|nr:hypothetical protein [Erysipelotrichaceae bacterium]